MFKFLALLLILLCLPGCSTSPFVDSSDSSSTTFQTSNSGIASADDTRSEIDMNRNNCHANFLTCTDISSDFVESSSVNFSENIDKFSISYDNSLQSDYAISDGLFIINSDRTKLLSSCTWSPSGEEIYWGLLDPASDSAYLVSALGGFKNGELSLLGIPPGKYHIVLIGQNISGFSSTMIFQFQ